MATIKIGTSGYSYNEWIGPVYPKGTKADQFLNYYANLFQTVELNFSYYKMPTATQLNMMAEQAPSLLFSIKAHQEMTHNIDPTKWRIVTSEYRLAISALQKRGALAAVLLQFPYSFHYEVDQRRYLHNLINALNELPLVVEFRNGQWYNNRTLDALRERSVALASFDLPPVKNSPPIIDVVTSSIAYIRLHGRNSSSWRGSDVANRYDYLYSEKELLSLAKRIESLALSAQKLFIYFNNHRRAQAVENATTLKQLLFSKEK